MPGSDDWSGHERRHGRLEPRDGLMDDEIEGDEVV
jgi:hypothetical protein